MITKKYFIIVLLCMFSVLFATEVVFAGNIGRAVYGVYTESYNGVGLNNASAGNDNTLVYASNCPEVTNDKFEGVYCYQLGNGGWVSFAFAGGAQNMSAYSGGRIYFSAKAGSDISGSLNLVYIKIQDSGGVKQIPFNSSNVKRVGSNDTGVLADGTWHSYYIYLSSFTDLHVNSITGPMQLSSNAPGNILVDYVYWTKAETEPRAFNVTVKNISDNQVLIGDDEKITWTQSAYRQSWTAAEQYVELDLDQESSNWYVTVYLDNGKASRNGLYCVDSDDSEIVLPMAWRIRPDLLPNSDGDTLQIARKSTGSKGLYDVGKNPGGTDWYTWSFMREIKAGIDNEDTVVWDLKGLHTVVWDHTSWDPLTSYVDRKPKIYFAADCSNAIGGLTYNATIVTELIFE